MRTNNLISKIVALVLALLVLLSLTAPVFAEEDPDRVYIKDAEDLIELAHDCALDTWSQGKTVVLQADISLDSTSFMPIPTFGGTFDGNGHTISGLKLTDSIVPAGLFGVLQAGAVVKDLKVSGTVTPAGDSNLVGGIVGENYGMLLVCSFNGTVCGDSNTGGIVGINAASGIIKNCQVSGAVTGSKMTGGIAGCNLGVIEACDNSAYINTSSVDPTLRPEDIHIDFTLDTSKITSLDTSTAAMDTGGIAGYSSGMILNCKNAAIVGYPHIGYNVGGIAGRSCGYLLACENVAEVYGRKDVGGIAGQLEPYIIKNMSESTLAKLERQLEELDALLEKAINDADDGVGTLTSRLNRIADAMGGAASAASDIRTYGSITGAVTGSGESSGEGSITVTPPQVEVGAGAESGGSLEVEVSPGSGSIEVGTSTGGEIHGGLTEGGVSGEGSSSASGAVDASAEIMVTTSLGGLSSAVYNMAGQVKLLSGEVDATSGALSQDIQAIREQVSAITDTAFELMMGDGEGDRLVDSSQVDIDLVTQGKAAGCENRGSINGDINVGGITGTMAMEYELDPEDDVTINISGTQRQKYEVKAIIQGSINRGVVTAKRSYAGGICGRMALGLIAECQGYGTITSENGNYVGGIAGSTDSTVRHCFAKCTLSGGMYVGGIVGTGTGEASDGDCSTVAGCYSLVDIPEYKQYAGAISGANAGSYLENYFVSSCLAGINRTSYSGQAEPLTYEELLLLFSRSVVQSQSEPEDTGETQPEETEPEEADETQAQETEPEPVEAEPEQLRPPMELPEEFRQFTLTFVADGVIIRSENFDYGDSFEDSIFPEVPQKEGYYGCWDRLELNDLQFDTVVTAVYTKYISATPSTQTRTSGRPIFFIEGQFDDGAEITVTPQANTPADFETLPKNWWSFLVNCFKGTRVSREIVEQWELEIPSDGQDAHTVRYLSPDGKPENRDIYVKQGGRWIKAESEVVGSYLSFQVEGTNPQIAVISTMRTWWIWLIAAALLVLLLVLIARLIGKILSRRKPKPTSAPADPETGADDSNADTPEANSDESDPSPAPVKKRRWLVPLLIVLALLCGILGTAAFFLLPNLAKDLKAYDLLKTYLEKPELTMALSVEAQAGDENLDFTALVDRTELDGHRVTAIAQENWKLFYTEDAVFLENGNAYGLDDAFPDYSKLLNQTMRLYQHVEISAKDDRYTITAEKTDAKALLELLIPSAASRLPEANAVTVELTLKDGEISELRFSGSGTLNDSGKTDYTISALMRMNPSGQSRISIPQNVKDAIVSDDYEIGGSLTGDLFRLLDGWLDLNSHNPLSARLSLKADCGPLVLNESLDLYRWTQDGRRIGSIQKNGFALYFTDTAICDKDGHTVSVSEASAMEADKLLDIAYQLCLNGEVDCREAGEEYTYTLSLDEDGMKAVAYAIAPATEEMDILFDSGSIRIVIREETIQSVGFTCGGNMQIVLSEVDVSLAAELQLAQEDVEVQIPEAVEKALKK